MREHDRFEDYPLRARKRAQTRVRLVEALVARLADRRLDEVSVAELCAEAEISQGTFFNYFPTKEDLLTHYIQLWSLAVALQARRARAQRQSALEAIEAIYAWTAAQLTESAGAMLEIIAHQARMPTDLVLEPVEQVERLLFLEDAPDVHTLPDRGLGELLPALLSEAVREGELPKHADVMQLFLCAASLFFGVPLLVGRAEPGHIGPLYQAQLQQLWASARR
ncbi:MAG: TetR/AcrR family transcriptional regulator [Alphaproteobacteria bacterium]|nr:TetR/AcrR family transcriptional regulator [Alphaproteobacteria bacterium]